MTIRIPGLITAHVAEAAITAYSIVKHGTDDGEVLLADDDDELLIGVSSEIASEIGEHTDVIRGGLAPVIYGGTVAAGALLTADATGRAVATTTAGAWVVGFAEVSGVVGDRGSVFVQPFRYGTPA